METRTEVRTVKVKFKCPKCEHGHLEFIGTRWVFNVHKCDNKECGHHEKFSDKKYPFFEYQELKKQELLSSSRRGYVVTELEDGIKRLLYGFPTGNGKIWECFGELYKITPDQQDKVKVEDVFLMEEVEIKGIPVEGTQVEEIVAVIKSLM